jgi:hypothetical protein
MTITLSSTINSASLNSKIFTTGLELVTKSCVLDATSGYSPTVGDVLVRKHLDSNKHDEFDHDDLSTKAAKTFTSATVSLGNITPIIPGTLTIYKDTAYTTPATIGTHVSVTWDIPSVVTILDTAAIAHSATITVDFCEYANQSILGVISEIDQTDTSDITMAYCVKGGVHYTALGTAGTATVTSKQLLIDQLADLGIIVTEN